MGKREEVIALSLKYEGDYFKIVEAIKNGEKIKGVNIDNAITIFDEEYPKKFFDLKYTPMVLYYKGNLKLLKSKKIKAIIGSRKPCEYSLKAVDYLIDKDPNSTYISGLALGIDAEAHKYSKHSIGVLGCGIDYVYPAANSSLYKKLEETGLILSEYPGKVKPLGFHFPFRNRIVAALADEINVMELTERSGTMTTVNEGLELGKEIKVLPFNLFDTAFVYNNTLINEGASIIQL